MPLIQMITKVNTIITLSFKTRFQLQNTVFHLIDTIAWPFFTKIIRVPTDENFFNGRIVMKHRLCSPFFIATWLNTACHSHFYCHCWNALSLMYLLNINRWVCKKVQQCLGAIYFSMRNLMLHLFYYLFKAGKNQSQLSYHLLWAHTQNQRLCKYDFQMGHLTDHYPVEWVYNTLNDFQTQE